MLKEAFMNADKLLGKFDLQSVVCYPDKENHTCFSCRTSDDLLFLYVRDNSVNEDSIKEFGLRNWSTVHSILGLNPEQLKITVQNDSYGYPSLLTFSSNNLSYRHYLQNYSFVSNQPDVFKMYKERRFHLLNEMGRATSTVKKEDVKTLTRVSSILSDGYFRIMRNESGKTVLYCGDLNQSIDTVTIVLDGTVTTETFSDNMYYSVDYFTQLYRAMGESENVKIGLLKNMIILVNDTESSTQVAIMKGKVQ